MARAAGWIATVKRLQVKSIRRSAHKESGRWIAFLGLAPIVPAMPAVVVVTVAVLAAAKAVHAIT